MLALLKRRATLHLALPSIFRLAGRKAGLSFFERGKPAVRSVRAKRYCDFRSALRKISPLTSIKQHCLATRESVQTLILAFHCKDVPLCKVKPGR